MRNLIFAFLGLTVLGAAIACGTARSSVSATSENPLPAPKASAPVNAVKGEQTAVFAGGCFWGVEAVFENVKGVTNAKSGYSGGSEKNANYDAVGGGDTGHAESVEVTFDPAVVTYGQLLQIFFSVAHDPTELNRQGPDVGTQYRSEIFYTSDEQKVAAENYIKELTAAKSFRAPIVTVVAPLDKFYDAEAYHQDYLPQNLKDPYIVANDLPKLEQLKKQFPALYAKK